MKLYIILLLIISLTFAQYSSQGSSGSVPDAFTGTLEVIKSAPESVSFGEQFDVTILVTNQGSQSVDGIVREFFGNVEPVKPLPTIANIENESYLAATPPVLTFNLSLAPGASETFTYTVKPKSVGLLSIGPSEVVVSGAKFFSNSLIIQVNCTSSLSCDETIGETPLNCPDKCGGNASIAPPVAPELLEIPTDPIDGPIADPMSTPPPQNQLNEKTGQMMIVGAVILILLAAGVYFFYFRKK